MEESREQASRRNEGSVSNGDADASRGNCASSLIGLRREIMQRSQFGGLAVVVLSIFVAGSRAAEEPKTPDTAGSRRGAASGESSDSSPAVDQTALEKKFAERMSGVVLAGSYSVTSGGKETPASME